MPPPETDRSLAYTYEAVFCIFLVALAFLGREDAGWAYPHVLYLLVALLALNLAAGSALRRWPGRRGLSTAVVLANCAVITAILHFSGGRGSRLWVLYLLPVFTASMFLAGKEVGWIASGAIAFNLAFGLLAPGPIDASAALDLGLRTGILTLAAALTWRLAERERRAQSEAARQRRELTRVLEQAQSRKADEASTQRLADIGMLTAGVLHDLKTPLTVILGFCDIGLKEADAEEMRADFQRIRASGLLCREIVGGVLAGGAKQDPALEPCDAAEVVRNTLAMSLSVLERKGIAVECVLPDDPLPVLASVPQLQRLFLNLISNAAQALSGGGTLSISARLLEAVAPGLPDRVELCFADDGPGLSEAALAGLFKAFSTTRSDQGGTGLGLYLCREIALSHAGSLRAENVPEGGARFLLTLPLRAEAAPPVASRFSSRSSAFHQFSDSVGC